MQISFHVLALLLIGVNTSDLCARPPRIKEDPAPKVIATPPSVLQAVDALNQYRNLQAQLNVQNADLAYGMKKALVMADLLISADGQLMPALCSALITSFIPANPLEYEINMRNVLSQLDASWVPFFNGIKASQDPNAINTLTLRALFGLNPKALPSDRQARVAVLAAMLAPYNQGPVGDCFAVTDVLRNHKEYFHHAAADYASIVTQGYLSRPVDHSNDNFFYVPTIADDDRSNTVTLDGSGVFAGTNYSLFDSPGFAAARAVMGGDDTSCSVTEVMSNLQGGDNSQLTAEQVIAAMASVIAANTSGDPESLTALGNYAFSSLTNNPVLRAIETSFAAMAEDRSNDSTRSNVDDCVATALKPVWTQLSQYSGCSQFQSKFNSVFNNSYRLVYNADVPLAQPAADGSSTTGAFTLYQRGTSPTQIGTQVVTPKQFQTLVANAATVTMNSLTSVSTATTIGHSLLNFINTDNFLKNALWAYDSANTQEPDPITHYQKLSRTPMISPDGDNPWEVDDVDDETSVNSNVQTYTPRNTQDLLTWCMGLAKVANVEMAPMDSPQHAFNFMPKNPDLIAYVNSKMTPSQWIQKTLTTPGMQVATATIDSATQNKMSEALWNVLSDVLPSQTPYQNLISHLASTHLTIQSYAQQLVTGINRLLYSNAQQAQAVANLVDSLLLQNLPTPYQHALTQSAIRFAFTNWNDGLKDIYFCGFFNPRNAQIAFGNILEDKTNLQPMSDAEWVNQQQWDVDLKPAAGTNLAMVSGS